MNTKLSEPLQLVLARALALSWQYWQASRRVEEGFSNSVGHTLDLLDTCTLRVPIQKSAISCLERVSTWLCHFTSLLEGVMKMVNPSLATALEHEHSEACLIGYRATNRASPTDIAAHKPPDYHSAPL